MSTTNKIISAAAGLAVLCLSAGCGGGRDPSSGRGAVPVTILWPAESRVIPPETRSIKLKAQVLEPDDGEITNDLVVGRPQGAAVSTATIPDVPSVKVRVLASAHVSIDGTGPPLASGSREVRVLENGTVAADIELTAIENPVSIQGGGAAGPCESVSFTASANVDVSATGPGIPIITLGAEGETEIRLDIPAGASGGVFEVRVTSRSDPSNFAAANYEVDTRIGSWITPSNTARVTIKKQFDGQFQFNVQGFVQPDGIYFGQSSSDGVRSDGGAIRVAAGGLQVTGEWRLPGLQAAIPFTLRNAACSP